MGKRRGESGKSTGKLRLGRYRHYRGNMYEVIGTAKHGHTLEDMVIYRSIGKSYDDQLLVRPLELFTEKVEIEGRNVPRFSYVGEE